MEGVKHRQTSLTSQVPYKVVDPIMGGEKALGRAGRFEPLHLPLASAGRLVRILRPVVQAFVPPMLDRRHHLRLRGAVAGELVRDHDTRGPALLFQQLAEQALGGPLGNYSPPHRDAFLLLGQQLTPISSRCRVESKCRRDVSRAASCDATLVVSSGTLLV